MNGVYTNILYVGGTNQSFTADTERLRQPPKLEISIDMNTRVHTLSQAIHAINTGKYNGLWLNSLFLDTGKEFTQYSQLYVHQKPGLDFQYTMGGFFLIDYAHKAGLEVVVGTTSKSKAVVEEAKRLGAKTVQGFKDKTPTDSFIGHFSQGLTSQGRLPLMFIHCDNTRPSPAH